MKILRSVTRRGFTVGTAGFFTVVSPNRWFAASRLATKSRPLVDQFEANPEKQQKVLDDPANQVKVALFLLPKTGKQDRHRIRLAATILVAAAITWFLLWWVFFRPHPVW